MHTLVSILRHRNARASALTMALSTRGRGAHGAPSGVTTKFHPPLFLLLELGRLRKLELALAEEA
jgi:hypothetical protein